MNKQRDNETDTEYMARMLFMKIHEFDEVNISKNSNIKYIDGEKILVTNWTVRPKNEPLKNFSWYETQNMEDPFNEVEYNKYSWSKA